MRGKVGDKVRLHHILDSLVEIESYLIEIDFSKFFTDSMMRYACIKHLEIIGEASNHISEEIKMKFNKINWPQIIGMRNILVHEYFGIDSYLIWQIIKDDLPEFKKEIQEIINSMN